MRRLLVCLAILLCFCSTGLALAGPNAGGTLILHVNESIVYCQDTASYCGQAGLASCAATDNSITGSTNKVFFAIAAFPNGSAPRLAGVTFGVTYDEATVFLVGQGNCANFELTTSGWPGNNSGTALTFNSPQTGLLTQVYWFAGYNYYSPDPATFALRTHPTQGGNFADNSVPAILDPIVGFGVLGFDTEGTTPCPVAQDPRGACCFPSGSCTPNLTASECAGQGGRIRATTPPATRIRARSRRAPAALPMVLVSR